MSDSCKDCKFWISANPTDTDWEYGECRFSPPTTDGWPRVSDTQWCGSYAKMRGGNRGDDDDGDDGD